MLAALPLVANAATPPFKAVSINMGNLSNYHFHQAYYTLQHNTYEHGSTLTGWLDLGLRSVELDVIDKDNWENDVNGPYVSHDKYAGNENCSGNPDRLGHCLRDIASWQDTHPGTGPILVFIDMKSSWDPAVAWQDDEVFSLDEKVRSILGRVCLPATISTNTPPARPTPAVARPCARR
jgi:hypothetical protein